MSLKALEKAVNGMALGRDSSWMIVLYNQCGVLNSSELEIECSSSGADNSRILTICSVQKSEGMLNGN